MRVGKEVAMERITSRARRVVIGLALWAYRASTKGPELAFESFRVSLLMEAAYPCEREH